MAKCHRNDVGSLVLGRTATATASSGGSSRAWAAFSVAALRRAILDALSCGGGGASSRRQQHALCNHDDEGPASATTTIRSALKESGEGSGRRQPPAPAPLQPRAKAKAEKLSDLLNMADAAESGASAEADAKKKEETLDHLKRVAKELQAEEVEVRTAAASRVRMLAKEDSEARTTLAMLGSIPPLVGMLDLEDEQSQIAALYALLNLGIGNDVNKAGIVKAGAVHKMLKLIESPNLPNPPVCEAIIANFLGLSALDSNKQIIGSSGAIPFLVRALKNLDNKSSSQAKQDALRALYNLSILQSNIAFILETDLIPYLLNTLGDMEVSERILSILGNVVGTPEGRKAIGAVADAFPILVDVLNWTDSPGCQEKASYIVMVMAHKAYRDRQAMIDAGIMSSLLELTLLGSTLAQKRASRILQCLRMDKGKQISESYEGNVGSTVSAPLFGSTSSSANPRDRLEEEAMMSEEKKAVKQLVQQSLQNNMRRIVKRANLPQDFVPSEHFKSLTSSSTSKSLPF